MSSVNKCREVEKVIRQVLGSMPLRGGDSFPMNTVCAHAARHGLSRNDVVDCLQTWKNQRLLTANERLTDAFVDYMRGARAA